MGTHFATKLIIHINMYVYYVYIMYTYALTINTTNMRHFNKKNGW